MTVDKVGKYVVYWGSATGTNTHHYHETYESAIRYCEKAPGNPEIGYVLATFTKRTEVSQVDATLLECLEKHNVKHDE